MARSVRFTKRADRNFRALPDAARALVARPIIALAGGADPSTVDELVMVAPAGPNSGSFMTIVTYGRYGILTIYRIKSAANELRILAVERIYGEGASPDAPAEAGRN